MQWNTPLTSRNMHSENKKLFCVGILNARAHVLLPRIPHSETSAGFGHRKVTPADFINLPKPNAFKLSENIVATVFLFGVFVFGVCVFFSCSFLFHAYVLFAFGDIVRLSESTLWNFHFSYALHSFNSQFISKLLAQTYWDFNWILIALTIFIFQLKWKYYASGYQTPQLENDTILHVINKIFMTNTNAPNWNIN